MTVVKVCGITHPDDLELAVDLDAAAVGFIFAESPRRVTVAQARDLVARLGGRPMTLGPVGVFVDAHRGGEWPEAMPFLRAIQAHGDEPPEFLAGLAGTARIKVFRIAGPENLDGIDAYNAAADYYLLDARVNGRPGGTGHAFDWGILEGRTFSRPIFLAGGLTPDNVGEAIRRVRPYGVDAASGTESTPGRKDPGRLRDFFAAVRDAG